MKLRLIIPSILAVVGIIFGLVVLHRQNRVATNKVVTKVLTAVSQIRAFSYAADIKIVGDVRSIINDNDELVDSWLDESGETVELRAVGSIDFFDVNNPVLTAKVNILGDGELTNATLDFRLLNQILYVMTDYVPEIQPGFDLSALAHNWISFPFNKDENNSVADTGMLLEKKISEIEQIIDKAKFLIISEEFVDEEYNGITVKHYAIAIDKDKLEKTAYQVEDFFGEIWVGIDDNLPRRFITHTVVNDDNMENQVIIDIDATFANFNKPVLVDIPNEPRSFEVILQEVIGGLFGGALLQGFDSAQVDYETGI